ncbi:DUF2267 domain-containing protein [Streptomyces griseoluteus]|uniref:DUF2267 domain-containing protein n=2 Tax=Streptomyces griseoluteus TaxID=29306 RepID=UPI0036AD603C
MTGAFGTGRRVRTGISITVWGSACAVPVMGCRIGGAMDSDEFIRLVSQRAHVPEEQAWELTRATMLTLGERITGGEARHLAGVLPAEIAPPLVPPEDVAQKFGVAEFVRRVSERAGVDEAVARSGVAAVFRTLREAVPGTEFEDVMSQLPNEFQNL